MTESADTAGALLRAAREKQGLHVAALAMMLKVPPRKLEALEAGRYDELQGATFVRALAQAACRALKLDPAPVLERLPRQDGGTLSQLERGLNTPFRERTGGQEGIEVRRLANPLAAVVALLLLGALAFWWWPAGWRPGSGALPAVSVPAGGEPSAAEPFAPPPTASEPSVDGGVSASPAASTASLPLMPAAMPPAEPAQAAVVAAPATVASTTLTPPALAPAATAAAPTAPTTGGSAVATSGAGSFAGGLLQVRARQASWVEVIDGRGQTVLARTLAAGESAAPDGVLPLRVKIGNAAGTELSFRGRPVPLVDDNGDNVVRLELK